MEVVYSAISRIGSVKRCFATRPSHAKYLNLPRAQKNHAAVEIPSNQALGVSSSIGVRLVEHTAFNGGALKAGLVCLTRQQALARPKIATKSAEIFQIISWNKYLGRCGETMKIMRAALQLMSLDSCLHLTVRAKKIDCHP